MNTSLLIHWSFEYKMYQMKKNQKNFFIKVEPFILISLKCSSVSFMLSNRPPLRQYLLDGEFFVGAAIACTLTKLALRYLDMEADKEKQNVSKWPYNLRIFAVLNTVFMYM